MHRHICSNLGENVHVIQLSHIIQSSFCLLPMVNMSVCGCVQQCIAQFLRVNGNSPLFRVAFRKKKLAAYSFNYFLDLKVSLFKWMGCSSYKKHHNSTFQISNYLFAKNNSKKFQLSDLIILWNHLFLAVWAFSLITRYYFGMDPFFQLNPLQSSFFFFFEGQKEREKEKVNTNLKHEPSDQLKEN